LDPGSGIRDPGSGMGKNQIPGSGTNIPDPQHCCSQFSLSGRDDKTFGFFYIFSELGIQIRMFLGLLDPDPLARGMVPDPAPSFPN
jgi:hypothetical protein